MAFVITNGTVAKTFFAGKGARIEEHFKTRTGEDAKKAYTLFTEAPHGLNEGDSVKASGTLSVRVREYETQEGETRHAADVVINGKAEVEASAADSPF